MSLTPKQHIFIDGILSGLNQSDAYKAAYDVSPDCLPSTVHNAAYALTQNPEIAASIEASRQHRRAWTLERILEEADRNLQGAQEDRQWAPANGALAFIGKATSLIQEKPTPDSVSITRVTIVLDAGNATDPLLGVDLSLNSNVVASLSEPSVEPSLEPGIEPDGTTATD